MSYYRLSGIVQCVSCGFPGPCMSLVDDERILLGLSHQPAQCVPHSEERNNGRLVCALHYSFQRHLVGFHGDVLIHPAGPQRTNERTDALVGLPANRQIWHSGIRTPTDLLHCWLMRPHPRPCRPRPHNHKIFFPIRTITGNLFVFASELVAGCLRIFLLLLCKYPYVGIYSRVCVLTCIRGQF